ncbi:hypothetical protein Tco_1003770 [Tanacetum coccineum]|uniref:Uncharacterized protein n=1 Tax=Tanacetum coccineum TaxID=301880 RepID=A0ABQ5FBV8_9ASTR
MPSFLSSGPTVNYFDDFDYFKDFEKEFPAIAYNDALTSKLDFSQPTVSPQHNDEFDETSLSECDDEGQNVIYFNDLFPFNVIYLDDLSDKGNDNDKIDIEHSSVDLSIEPLPNVIKIDTQGSNKLLETRSGSRFDTAYPMGWIRRIGVSWSRDHVRYLLESSHTISSIRRIGLLWICRIDLRSFVVFGECRHRYAVSSLMDTAYWSSE